MLNPSDVVKSMTRPLAPTRGFRRFWVRTKKKQIPSDLVVKSQVADIIDLILQLIGYPNGVHRPCHNRKSRAAVFSTSEGQWATTKFDGVCEFEHHADLCVFGETERQKDHAGHQFSMRYRYNRGYRYRLTNPPKTLLRA